MKAKREISVYIIRSAAVALLLSSAIAFARDVNPSSSSAGISSRQNAITVNMTPTVPFSPAAPKESRTLSFGDRVAYQYAIEEIYWRHRVWPKENSGPKPSLDDVMSRAQVEQKVQTYLRDSQSLADEWQKPITPEQLQAEMDRMASQSKQPEVLQEIFNALGNDPALIAECLARPVLSERLIREPYAQHDESLHRDRAKSELVAHRRSAKAMREPFEMWAAAAEEQTSQTPMELAGYTLPQIASPSTDCTPGSWLATQNAPTGRAYHATAWTGSEMIVWGGVNGGNYLNSGGRYNPTTNSWTAITTTNAPDGRIWHTAVWTGSEVIIWGGAIGGTYLNSGGRYNPITDSWAATSAINAPAGREYHTGVWTGNEMIIWGGSNGDILNSGGRYNPNTNSWVPTTTTNAPDARAYHTAVWSGNEMIVWGGSSGSGYMNSGGRYNPTTNNWVPTSIVLAPMARELHTAVWTGSEMIVWGGINITNNFVNSGGRYNPTTDSWLATTIINAPSAREYHTAAWTGSEMIVWGGYNVVTNYLNSGGRYNPTTDGWVATTTDNAPAARELQTGVWTGSEIIVWGGYNGSFLNTGGRYCAQSQAPIAQSALSRKVHGTAGIFDVPLPVSGNVGIECRSGGATNDYQMIINFMTSVTVGGASMTSGTGSVSSFIVTGSQVIVNLTGITNVQTITVTLSNVNDGTHMGNVPVSMGVLVGDTNANGTVNAADVAQTRSVLGQNVDATNFRSDVNASGTLNATDAAMVKQNSGNSLSPN